jgi:hypothetical protein
VIREVGRVIVQLPTGLRVEGWRALKGPNRTVANPRGTDILA